MMLLFEANEDIEYLLALTILVKVQSGQTSIEGDVLGLNIGLLVVGVVEGIIERGHSYINLWELLCLRELST